MLSSEKALELARRLTVVADFPTYSEAIEAVAEDLVVLTENSPSPDIAEARARWLVTEIRRTWTRWSGCADLVTMYRKRFNPPREVKAEDNEAKNYGAKPPIRCRACNDTGVFRQDDRFAWCECETGILLHFDLPDWLDTLNRFDSIAPFKPDIPPPHPAVEKIVSPEVEKRIEKTDECPACSSGNPHTHQQYWKFHCPQEKISV